MFQNSIQNNGCCSEDYALLTAVTGIATISTPNPNLDGTGSISTVINGGTEGVMVRSVTIQAIQPVTSGMVRLYITSPAGVSVLYKEIPIPNTPALDCTPTPTPILPMFTVMLAGGLKLPINYALSASTQNAESFKVIAEGLQWTYPATLPDYPSNFIQEVAAAGAEIITVGNTNLDGSGNIAALYQALPSANGARIKSITIKALQSTNLGMIRIFVGPNTSSYSLLKEIYIPQTTQSGFDPSFKQVVELDYNIQSSYYIGVSSQLGQKFAISLEGVTWTYPI
jgi:hypothetical protein